ncbi:hypothetical protein Tco_1166426 [Tanacetum coccineum]
MGRGSKGTRDFSNILACVESVVSNNINYSLESPVTNCEIHKAVKELGALKAPGNDGFPGLFFQRCWHIVGDSVIMAVKQFFDTGIMPPTLNKTLVVLIPKVPCPEQIGQFRPISLCNFVYRTISKIMANRLKPHLHKIVSPQQSAFIPGRLIQDSIVIANEAFHYIRNKKKGSQQFMALKLDLSKAFDRVEWDFLLESLKRLDFGNKWCTWISACISSYELEFMINGNSIGTIKPSRGIRQGDPISPFLFIIVADVLSKMINNALNNSLLSGMKMARECPVISHIFFADDSLFFLKASINECNKLISILDKYCAASGQSINFSKSAAIFSPNTSQELQLDLCRRLQVSFMDTKGTYLGLPTIHGRNKNELFSFILDRVLKKMQGWKQKFLSHAGRTILIKSVIQAIPSYAMQCYLLPDDFLNKLMSHVKRFFWGGDAHEKHIHWVKWERMSHPKEECGLGFRDLNALNLALLAKQGWRLLINPHSFWGRVLKGLYFPRSNFLTARKGSRPSWLWQSLLQGRDLLLEGIRWQGANFIAQIPISRTHTNDRIIWHYDAKGNYTVKSGYRQALKWRNFSVNEVASSSSFPNPGFWKKVWNMKVMPKIKTFWWRACSNALATRENLYKRKCSLSPLCQICNSQVETIEHVFFECPWMKSVWFGSNYGLRADNVSGNFTSRISSLIDIFPSKSQALKLLASIAITSWNI